MKYVLVTGGVVSGLGKGVTASSIGLLLQACGLRVTSIKIDPYLNTDAGTMSPFEHGEVFVLDDGGEVDLDLGNYERFLDSTLTHVHKAAWDLLKGADGILVPGGFGDRGVQGKILATKYARENQVPFLGICLGMQLAVVEFARSILGYKDANSTEFEPETSSPCVIFMPEGSTTHMGGTMRLGSRRTHFQVPDCKTAKLYGNAKYVDERHRHRYEVNPDMIPEIENAGLSFVGKDGTGRRMEIVELQNHPYFVGVQFHPEFKSRPGKPSALFLGLIAAASGCLEAVLQGGKMNKVLINGMANGTAMGKFYQNGNVYSNGNGLHH
ncbi:hypothetical protein BRARA_A03322 [Brassica rapa]|uniref:CTP synthase n=1 Tax=Brassica campestris TaxID=3711 RepID=A0A398ASH6_BRACM|nr:hypothetical protein BRARA_A03322 [Brassica rapa]